MRKRGAVEESEIAEVCKCTFNNLDCKAIIDYVVILTVGASLLLGYLLEHEALVDHVGHLALQSARRTRHRHALRTWTDCMNIHISLSSWKCHIHAERLDTNDL